jgi:photosystem II stability/assembly factor-like uncharacterized protein
MKKIIEIFLFVFVLQSLCYGQIWQNLTPKMTASLTDIAMQDANTIYVGGLKGEMFKTSNAGTTWTELQTGTTKHISSLTFAGGVLYALAEGTILRCSDGSNFINTDIPNYQGNEIYFFNDYYGFITGGPTGKIAKTSNAGLTWEVVQTNYQGNFKKVFFVSVTNGFAIAQEKANGGAKCVILKTTDGGLNWTQVYEETNVVLNDLYFTDATFGYCVGNNGKILKTANGGNSFTVVTSNVTTMLNSVTFTNDFIGYAIGTRGTILKTFNRGATWQTLTSPKEYPFIETKFLGNVGYVLISGNKILKTTNGGL